MKRQTFWYSIVRDEMYRTVKGGSSFCRNGDRVEYSHYDNDQEDGRMYHYECEFSTEDYRRALQEVQESCESNISGEGGCRLGMRREKDDYIALTFSARPSPGRTPGGSGLSGSITTRAKLEKLLLED